MIEKYKRKILFFLGVLLVVSFSCFMFACSKIEGYTTEYTLEAGEVFYIPADLGEVEVSESSGSKVSVVDRSFIANSLKGYTIKVKNGNKDVKVNVVDTTPPQIYGEEYILTTVNKVLDFSSYTSVDKLNGDVETVLYNGQTPINNKKFTPKNKGQYTLTLKSHDYLGNESVKEILVNALEQGDRKLERVTAFSEQYGVNQTSSLNGLNVEFSNLEKFNDTDQGSLKITALLDGYSNSSSWFTLGNAIKKDLTATNGIYFRVKVGTGHSVNLKFSSSYIFVLQPNQWNEIYLDIEALQLISQETKTDVVTRVEDLRFEITTLNHVGAGGTVLYFSDIYYLPKMDTEAFRTRVQALNLTDIVTEQGLEEWTYLNRIYNSYNVGSLNNIADLYGVLDKMYLQAFSENASVTYEQGKVAYTDSALGAKQFISSDLSATFSFDAQFENASGTKGSTKVSVGDAWGASIKLAYPYVDSAYSTTDIDAYEDSLYGTVKFNVFWKGQPQKQMVVRFNEQMQAITSGQWCEVTFKLYNKSFKDLVIYFYAGTDVGYGGWLSNTEFYLSPFYVTKAITVTEVEQKIDALIQANIPASSFASNATYKDAINAYNELSFAKRNLVNNRQALLSEMQEKLSSQYGVQMSNEKVFFFDSELGLHQINPINAKVEYATNVKYGNEAGSLKIVSNRAWDAGVDLLFPFNKKSNLADSYTFRVYLEGAKNISIHFATWNEGTEPIILMAGKWTEITIPKGMLLEENRLFMYANGWNALLPEGVTVYVSAIYAN